MRFIRDFQKFESSYIDSLGSGDQISDSSKDSSIELMIKEYNQKKPLLISIFKSKDPDDKIRLSILSKVYSGDKKSQNKLLNRLESILWIERSISNIDNKKKESSVRKSEIEKKLTDLYKVVNVVDGKAKKEVGNSIINLESEIKTIDDSLKSSELKIKELESELKKEKDDFSKFEREIYTKIRG